METKGAEFGAGFDPDDVETQNWGRLEIAFRDNNSGALTYNGKATWNSACLCADILESYVMFVQKRT
jgi:hypothetical protein